MRTVLVYLSGVEQESLDLHLDASCERIAGSPTRWNYPREGDPVLYVARRTWSEVADLEPEQAADVLKAVGGACALRVCIDVSGRHDGAREVRELVEGLLRAFRGKAADEFADHLWTLGEIEQDVRVEGHSFFDYGRR